jgi:hypothetical protein
VLTVLSHQKTLNFPPGSEFLYSNTGFTLLAQVVKHVGGESFRAFTTQRLFQPLGMTHTHFRDNHAEVVKDIAYGYNPAGDRFELSIPNFDTVGATSLLTTVEDLALWDENFYTPRVGNETIIRQLQETGRLNDGTPIGYAAGLEIGTYRGLKTVGHAGADAGYRADMIRFPEHHFSVATLCNLGSIDPSKLNRRIADIYLATVFPPANDPEGNAAPFQPAPDRLAAMAGVYVDADDGDRVLRLQFKDGKLLGGGFRDTGDELKALDDTRFRYLDYPTELVFQGGSDAAPQRLTAHVQGMKPHEFVRVSVYAPSGSELEAFTGQYRSEELETPYEVIVEDDHLLVRSFKTRLVIRPVTTDLFVGSGNRVRFTRDASGHVAGLLLNTARTRNFRFERVPR